MHTRRHGWRSPRRILQRLEQENPLAIDVEVEVAAGLVNDLGRVVPAGAEQGGQRQEEEIGGRRDALQWNQRQGTVSGISQCQKKLTM